MFDHCSLILQFLTTTRQNQFPFLFEIENRNRITFSFRGAVAISNSYISQPHLCVVWERKFHVTCCGTGKNCQQIMSQNRWRRPRWSFREKSNEKCWLWCEGQHGVQTIVKSVAQKPTNSRPPRYKSRLDAHGDSQGERCSRNRERVQHS